MQEQELAVLAAFFCLLFFAAAKKSRCRPAQGRRLNGKHHIADASENPKNQTGRATKTKRGCHRKQKSTTANRFTPPLASIRPLRFPTPAHAVPPRTHQTQQSSPAPQA